MVVNNLSNIENYAVSFLHARRMHELGIITESDLNKVDMNLRKKYSINNKNIYVKIDWIKTPLRGNM